jgi:HSP20 family protein
MQLVRRERSELPGWSVFEQLFGLRNELNRMTESPFGEQTRNSECFIGWAPALDLYEDTDNLIVKAELPGLKKEDIEISLHDGALAISGERKQEAAGNKGETYRSERYYGRFHRAVSLPKPVAGDKVKANFTNGVLTVTLPKTEEAKPKQIEVNIG